MNNKARIALLLTAISASVYAVGFCFAVPALINADDASALLDALALCSGCALSVLVHAALYVVVADHADGLL